MNPALYIFLNRELGMSTGKAAAQAGHAVHLSIDHYWRNVVQDESGDPHEALDVMQLYGTWMLTGYTKLVMEARDATHMMTLERYFKEHGYKSFMVIDEGRTEIAAHSLTALATEVVDRDDPRAWIFKEFKLYKDPKPTKEKPAIGLEPKRKFFRR